MGDTALETRCQQVQVWWSRHPFSYRGEQSMSCEDKSVQDLSVILFERLLVKKSRVRQRCAGLVRACGPRVLPALSATLSCCKNASKSAYFFCRALTSLSSCFVHTGIRRRGERGGCYLAYEIVACLGYLPIHHSSTPFLRRNSSYHG